MDFAHGESVTRLRGTPVLDPYSGEPTGIEWDTPPGQLVIPGVGVEPRPSGEPTQDARNSTTSGFTLYGIPSGTDITPADRMRIRGVDYDVDGGAADWRNPFTGWAPGLVVQTKRVVG